MLDAVLHEWFDEWFRVHRINQEYFEVRAGDFVSVYIKDIGVYTGTLVGSPDGNHAPATVPTNDKIFVRLPSNVVFHADLVLAHGAQDVQCTRECFFIEGQENNFFSGILTNKKPTQATSVLLTKVIPQFKPSTFFMWGDLAPQFARYVPDWARRTHYAIRHV